MINLAGIDASVLTCGSGFDQPDIPIAGRINDLKREAIEQS